ncbi:ATP-binding cassette domain-containing protein [Dyadobacter sp. SG02]|uniref:ATP-binding cassette domain-containing protein n=1 Tax=Dyadobacter sp. SG02 TaxID=1855291 RepID=UPI0015A6C820|nr:ATP-binding cassette domain-containing protein [Dyadobacter sp. SG02]
MDEIRDEHGPFLIPYLDDHASPSFALYRGFDVTGHKVLTPMGLMNLSDSQLLAGWSSNIVFKVDPGESFPFKEQVISHRKELLRDFFTGVRPIATSLIIAILILLGSTAVLAYGLTPNYYIYPLIIFAAAASWFLVKWIASAVATNVSVVLARNSKNSREPVNNIEPSMSKSIHFQEIVEFEDKLNVALISLATGLWTLMLSLGYSQLFRNFTPQMMILLCVVTLACWSAFVRIRPVFDMQSAILKHLKVNYLKSVITGLARERENHNYEYSSISVKYYHMAVENLRTIVLFLRAAVVPLVIFCFSAIYLYGLIAEKLGTTASVGMILYYFSSITLLITSLQIKRCQNVVVELLSIIAGFQFPRPKKLVKGVKHVELRDISVELRGQKILEKVSIKIQKGAIHSILASSGHGKTALASVLSGMLHATTGEIKVDGQRFDQVASKLDVYVLNANNSLFPGTVLENIVQADKNLDFERISKFCSSYGFDKFFKELPSGLATLVEARAANIPYSYQSVILLARAIYHYPDILIYDNAFARVDERFADFIANTLVRVKYDIIVVTMELNEATVSSTNKYIYI